MLKKTAAAIAILLYILAAAGLIFYFIIESKNDINLSPAGKLATLCFSCCFIYLGSVLLVKKVIPQRKVVIMRTTFVLFFGIYVILILTLTLFDSYYMRTGLAGFSNLSFERYVNFFINQTNFIPFKTILQYLNFLFTHKIEFDIIITNLAGNLIAFSPLAFFYPLLLYKVRKISSFLISMIITVAFIEIFQFILLTGSLDIDDVILNVGGACAMYGILHIKPIRKLINKFTLIEY